MFYLLEPMLGGADTVLQDLVFEHQVTIALDYAVHLGRVEERREKHVDQRHKDETYKQVAQQTIRTQPMDKTPHLILHTLLVDGQLHIVK